LRLRIVKASEFASRNRHLPPFVPLPTYLGLVRLSRESGNPASVRQDLHFHIRGNDRELPACDQWFDWRQQHRLLLKGLAESIGQGSFQRIIHEFGELWKNSFCRMNLIR